MLCRKKYFLKKKAPANYGNYLSTWIEDKKKNVNRAMSFQDDVGNLKAQMREQTRTIADLKQSLMVSDLVAVRVLNE